MRTALTFPGVHRWAGVGLALLAELLLLVVLSLALLRRRSASRRDDVEAVFWIALDRAPTDHSPSTRLDDDGYENWRRSDYQSDAAAAAHDLVTRPDRCSRMTQARCARTAARPFSRGRDRGLGKSRHC